MIGQISIIHKAVLNRQYNIKYGVLVVDIDSTLRSKRCFLFK